jgi:hypothetical protein
MTNNKVQKDFKSVPTKPTQESNVVNLGEASRPKPSVQQPPKPSQESNIVTKSANPHNEK